MAEKHFNPLTPCGVRQHLCPKFLLRINAFAQNLHTNSQVPTFRQQKSARLQS